MSNALLDQPVALDDAALRAGTLAYPCAVPDAPPSEAVASGKEAAYVCEVMGTGKFQKIGIVREQSTGRAWRLSADEGTYLRGTDHAPAPLMHFGAGLASDLAARITAEARNAGVSLTRLRVVAQQGFASKGSFVRGEAQAEVFDLHWQVEAGTSSSLEVVEGLVGEALHASPVAAAMTGRHEGTFALYANGRPVPVAGVPQSHERPPLDPFIKYKDLPKPLDEDRLPAIFAKHPADAAVDRLVLSNDSQGSIQWHIHAVADYDFERNLIATTVGFPEVSGSSRWTLYSDATGRLAPSPLALFSIGAAFCYHTQLCRYVEVRHLPIAATRLVQTSRFAVNNGVGEAFPFDTHLFTNGRAQEQDTRTLLTLAANTCYAHRGLATVIPQHFTIAAA